MYRCHEELGHGTGSDGDTDGVVVMERLDVNDTELDLDNVMDLVHDRDRVGETDVCNRRPRSPMSAAP